MKKKLAKLAARILALEDTIAKLGKNPRRGKRKQSKPAKPKKLTAARGKRKAKKPAVRPVAGKSDTAPKAKATARDPSSAAV